MRRSLAVMKEILKTFGQNYKIFFAVAAMILIQLVAAEKIYLSGAILIGLLLSFFYIISVAARLETAAKMNSAQAKRIMLVGMVLRLLMVFVVLAVAIRISTELFLASASCFVTFYVTSLGVLIYSERR